MKEILDKIEASSDEEIIKRILDGEISLLEILIRRYNPVLYKIARSYGFQHHDAEDLMQEAHTAAYFNLNQFEQRSSYKTWLSRIMIHKCLYKLRYGYFSKEKPLPMDAEPNNDFEPSTSLVNDVNRRELSRVIEFSLQRLPLPYRMVFLLRQVEGYSVKETAELLNLTPVNVKVRLNRAKNLLQKELEQLYSSSNLYEFNLVYCNAIVERVFQNINQTPLK